MTKINVIHIIGGGEFGGAEQHILNLLPEIDPNKFNVTLCCLFPEPLAQIAQDLGIPIVYLKMHSKFDLRTAIKFAKLLKAEKIDIVHTHGVRANLIGRLGTRLAGVGKVVTTVHSELKHDQPRFLTRTINILLEKATQKITGHFIVVSDSIRKSLIQQGVKEKNISVIYNGIDLAVFRPGKSNFTKKIIDADDNDVIVGVVARLHTVKGHKFLIEAVKMLAQKDDKIKLVIVGEGPCQDEIKKQIEKLELTEKVFILGFLDNVADVMRSIDILAIPSISEGFGLTAVEAMAVKTPVVATEVGGLPEIIINRETGILVPAGDSAALAEGILWLINHPEHRKAIVERAFEHIKQNFSKTEMARHTMTLYKGLEIN